MGEPEFIDDGLPPDYVPPASGPPEDEAARKKRNNIIIAVSVGLIGCCAFLMIGVPIIAAIAIPNLLSARVSGNESSTIGSLKALASAQALFREADKEGDGTLDYATNLQELGAAGLIDNVLSSGTKSGYSFTLTGSQYTWSVTADPVVPGATGNRYFFVDESAVIRYSSSTPTGPTDLAIGK